MRENSTILVPVIVDVDVIVDDEPEADYVCQAKEWLSWLKQAFV